MDVENMTEEQLLEEYRKVKAEIQNREINLFISDKEFITEGNNEEVFSLVESFLNRWKDLFIKENINDYPNSTRALKHLYMFMPTDKQKLEIIRDMIKDFSKYKNQNGKI